MRLAEMATNGPGFTVDEDFESLGQNVTQNMLKKTVKALLATLPQIKTHDSYGKMMSIRPEDLAERKIIR